MLALVICQESVIPRLRFLSASRLHLFLWSLLLTTEAVGDSAGLGKLKSIIAVRKYFREHAILMMGRRHPLLEEMPSLHQDLMECLYLYLDQYETWQLNSLSVSFVKIAWKVLFHSVTQRPFYKSQVIAAPHYLSVNFCLSLVPSTMLSSLANLYAFCFQRASGRSQRPFHLPQHKLRGKCITTVLSVQFRYHECSLLLFPPDDVICLTLKRLVLPYWDTVLQQAGKREIKMIGFSARLFLCIYLYTNLFLFVSAVRKQSILANDLIDARE